MSDQMYIWAGFILSTGSDYLELSYVRQISADFILSTILIKAETFRITLRLTSGQIWACFEIWEKVLSHFQGDIQYTHCTRLCTYAEQDLFLTRYKSHLSKRSNPDLA